MKKAVPRYGVRNVSGSVELAFKALNEGRGVRGLTYGASKNALPPLMEQSSKPSPKTGVRRVNS